MGRSFRSRRSRTTVGRLLATISGEVINRLYLFVMFQVSAFAALLIPNTVCNGLVRGMLKAHRNALDEANRAYLRKFFS